jgi:hypothetical protein
MVDRDWETGRLGDWEVNSAFTLYPLPFTLYPFFPKT